MSIELVWTLIATAGLVVAVWGFLDANADVHAVPNRTNGRRIIARGYRRDEAISVVIQAILLGIGLGPVIEPEPVRLSAFVVALIVVNLLLLARSLLAARDRLQVRRSDYPPPKA